MVFLFSLQQGRKTKRSVRPPARRAYSTITRITKKRPWRQHHRRQHVHFTDADEKTTHSTVTAIQNLVILAIGAELGIREGGVEKHPKLFCDSVDLIHISN
jgi:hypothetical protein